MTESGVNLKTIGLFAFLRIPYSLKFLWSPLMDRFSFPFLDRRRSWIVVTQILLAISLVLMGFLNPISNQGLVVILAFLINFFSASQDIVQDAYRREVLKDEELGTGSGLFVNGYLIAFRWISGAFAILISGYVTWGFVYQIMGAIMALLALCAFRAPKADMQVEPPKSIRDAIVQPLSEYFSRPGAVTILAFIVLYKLGDNLASTMSIPYILKMGFSKEEYVAIAKVWGLIATMLGGLLGGYFVMAIGMTRSLFLMGVLQALSTAAFMILNTTLKGIPALIGVIGFENLTAGMGTSAYAAYMASITNRKFTATQYALLSSLMAIPGVIFGSRAGDWAETFGWNGFFLGSALAAIPGMLLIFYISEVPKKFIERIFVKLVVTLTVIAGVYAIYQSTIDLFVLFFVPKPG